MYIITWNHESEIYINDTQKLAKYFKVKYGSIFIGYYKSHGVGIMVIWGESVIGKSYGLL